MSLSEEVRSKTWFEYSEWAAAHGTREDAFLKIDQRGIADRIAELESQLAQKTKEFDSLIKRDTSNLKRLIEAQAQLAETKQYLFHTPDCDMSIAHNLMGTSPNGCNCGLIELQAILK